MSSSQLKNWLFIFVLLLFFEVGFVTLRSIFIIAAVFILFNSVFYKLFDLHLFFLSGALVFYLLFPIFNQGVDGVTASLVILPVCAYLIGKLCGSYFDSEVVILWLIFFMGLAISLPTLMAVIYDIYINGFIGFSRNIALLGGQGEQTSATVLAANLIIPMSLLGLLLTPADKMSYLFRLCCFILFAISLFVVVRLGSRTLIVIGLVVAFISLIRNFKKFNLAKLFFLLCLFVFAVIYYHGEVDDAGLFSFYMDRTNDDSATISSAGGRSDRWINSFALLIDHPFGWHFEETGYAHNLWLDAARVGGIPIFLMFSILSVLHIRMFFKFMRLQRGGGILGSAFSYLYASYFLLFFVEPILDGFILIFSSFCFFAGLLVAASSKYGRSLR